MARLFVHKNQLGWVACLTLLVSAITVTGLLALRLLTLSRVVVCWRRFQGRVGAVLCTLDIVWVRRDCVKKCQPRTRHAGGV